MNGANTKRASLAQLRQMKDEGKLVVSATATHASDVLDEQFWREVRVEGPRRARSVHLKLDQDVFDYFYAVADGKGHLTRMQNVPRAYVKAQKGL